MGSCQSPFSAWSLPLGEKPGLGDWGAGFQPLLRDSFHMWLWMSQFPLWNSGLPSPQGRSRAGWVHRCPLGTSPWGELLRLQKDKKTSPQPSGDSNLLMPGTFIYSFSPQNMDLLFFSHYESSSCLLFKKYIQKTQRRKTKAEIIPINLTCPETTTEHYRIYSPRPFPVTADTHTETQKQNKNACRLSFSVLTTVLPAAQCYDFHLTDGDTETLRARVTFSR